jgi:energy-coupling factor transporter ATP-binding protein EcfA2
LATLPKWLQTGASGLLHDQKLPDAPAVKKLADLCLAEETKEMGSFSSVPPGAFDVMPGGVHVRLQRIEALKGVNALVEGASLDFGDANLCVVYGQNGSGKSGFARITKHAANAPTSGNILSNVFNADKPEISADFVIDRDGQLTTTNWKFADGPIAPLRSLHVFDGAVAKFYITEKAEATHEPRRLRFITALVSICDQVKADLQTRIDLLPATLPSIPATLSSTETAKFLDGLGPKQTQEAVTKRLAILPTHEERKRIIQEALQSPDPAARLTAIDSALLKIKILISTVESICAPFKDEAVQAITNAKANAVAFRLAANQSATETLNQAKLPGVGAPIWRIMWEAARDYSNGVAYDQHPFPHVGQDAYCPLCQQKLDDLAKRRMESFEAFIKGRIELKAKEAADLHEELRLALPALPTLDDWKIRFSSIPDAQPLAIQVYSTASKGLASLAIATKPQEVTLVDTTALLAVIGKYQTSLETERETLVNAQKGNIRQKLESELRELKMLDWGHENLPAILKDLERKKKIAMLESASKRTNTAGLTRKKGELAQEELTGGYQDRFAMELKALGAEHIQVKPVEADKAKGKIKFSLAIVGSKKQANLVDVLSDGEARIVAFAAFLADVTVAGARTPFLFDDPISSLDAEFEEKVVERLIELAKTRQVLVFTHRLSLLTLLMEAVKKEKKFANAVEGEFPIRHKAIALRRLEDKIGLVTDLDVREAKLEVALDKLISRRLKTAKEVMDSGDIETYTALMKAICSDLRILVERAVEEHLLNEVVVRFRRQIITKDKLTPLAKIRLEDCQLIDGLMTRYSCFEHSQPKELPVKIPTHSEVLREAQEMLVWVREFGKRLVEVVSDPEPILRS